MQGPAWSAAQFRGRALLVITAMLAVVIVNGVLAGLVRHRWEALLASVIAIPFLLVTHVSINSGFTSSNLGTYFRETEPVRFWRDNILTGGAVVVLVLVPWFIK